VISDSVQRAIDAFYWERGPCCAGCDWWRHLNSVLGDCTKSAPVTAEDRYGMTGFSSPTLLPSAGHVITPREHVCGDFKDEFDWSSLTMAYRKDVGAPLDPKR